MLYKLIRGTIFSQALEGPDHLRARAGLCSSQITLRWLLKLALYISSLTSTQVFISTRGSLGPPFNEIMSASPAVLKKFGLKNS